MENGANAGRVASVGSVGSVASTVVEASWMVADGATEGARWAPRSGRCSSEAMAEVVEG